MFESNTSGPTPAPTLVLILVQVQMQKFWKETVKGVPTKQQSRISSVSLGIGASVQAESNPRRLLQSVPSDRYLAGASTRLNYAIILPAYYSQTTVVLFLPPSAAVRRLRNILHH